MSCSTNRSIRSKGSIFAWLRIYGHAHLQGVFYQKYLALAPEAAGDLTKANTLFWLSAANNEVMSVSKYFEANITILGFKVPWAGFLVVKDPNALLEPQHSTQLPGVIEYNMMQLGCDEFGRCKGSMLSRSSTAWQAFIQWYLHNFVHFTIRASYWIKLKPQQR